MGIAYYFPNISVLTHKIDFDRNYVRKDASLSSLKHSFTPSFIKLFRENLSQNGKFIFSSLRRKDISLSISAFSSIILFGIPSATINQKFDQTSNKLNFKL
jgi:hypothetical protein